MNDKKGISLITLVITIIIIIILAGVVILNLSDNNPIENSEKARIMEDTSTFASDLTVIISKLYADNAALVLKNINSTTNVEDKYYITKLVPSLKNEKVGNTLYSDILIVRGGRLYFNEDKKDLVTENEYNAIIEVLGKYSPSNQDNKDENNPINPDPKSYTITYKINDGTDNIVETQIKEHGENVTIIADIPTREGYTFLGWSENKDALVADIASGSTYTKDGNVTLYAIWKIQTYTITYNANGGTGTMSVGIKNKDESYTISSNRFTAPNGYTFGGWTTSSLLHVVEYSPLNTYTTNANLTLYAIWYCNGNTTSTCTGTSVICGGSMVIISTDGGSTGVGSCNRCANSFSSTTGNCSREVCSIHRTQLFGHTITNACAHNINGKHYFK